MRGTMAMIFALCLVAVWAQSLASGKMSKKDRAARLNSLQTIFVDGAGAAANDIREKLPQETCLEVAPARAEADAILEVDEEGPGPCSGGMPGMCQSITVQLVDAKTNEALWLTSDDSMPVGVQIHPLQGTYGWVFAGLRKACCKDRPTPAQPKN